MGIMNDPDWPAGLVSVSPTLYEHLPGSLRELRGANRVSGGGIECDVSA
jgi:hypothetical protein